jgi:hypothetical protein
MPTRPWLLPALILASPLAAQSNSPASSVSSASPVSSLAITHVTVIDVATGERTPDRTVIVRGGRIAAVGPSALLAVPTNVRLVEGRNGFLVPGLWDMHVHMGGGGISDTALVPLLVVNGITSVRDMGADPKALAWVQRWRASVAAGSSLWPRVVAVGAMIDGRRPEAADWAWVAPDSAAGVAAVDSVRQGRWDEVKLQDWITPETFDAITGAAHAAHRPIVGHAPFTVGVARAADAGYLTLEHLGNDYVGGMLVDCSTIEDSLRAAFLVSERAHDEKAMESARSAWWIDRLLETQDRAKCEALARRLAERGVWQTPTIWISLWFPVFRRDSLQVPAERLRYYPKSRRPAAGPPQFRADQTTAEDRAAWLRLYQAQMELIALLHRSGAGFLAGSDTGPWNRMLPGFSLHDELQRLVAAGFTPLEALQAATLNPARALSLTDSVGAIRVGLGGDLLLLDADPLIDIANLRRIRAVVIRGRLVDQVERARLLDEVAQAADRL